MDKMHELVGLFREVVERQTDAIIHYTESIGEARKAARALSRPAERPDDVAARLSAAVGAEVERRLEAHIEGLPVKK